MLENLFAIMTGAQPDSAPLPILARAKREEGFARSLRRGKMSGCGVSAVTATPGFVPLRRAGFRRHKSGGR